MDDPDDNPPTDADYALLAAVKVIIDILLAKRITSQTHLRGMFEDLARQFDKKNMADAVVMTDDLLRFVGDPNDPASRERIRRLLTEPAEGEA